MDGKQNIFDTSICRKCLGLDGGRKPRWRVSFVVSELENPMVQVSPDHGRHLCFSFPMDRKTPPATGGAVVIDRWLREEVDPETDLSPSCPHLAEHVARKYDLLVGFGKKRKPGEEGFSFAGLVGKDIEPTD